MKNLQTLLSTILLACIISLTSCDDNGGEAMVGTEGADKTTSGYNYPNDRRYSVNHEWMRIDGDSLATVGVTPYAVDQLGIVGYISILEEGEPLPTNRKTGRSPEEILEELRKRAEERKKKTVEYPIAGSKTMNNPLVIADPTTVSSSPMSTGWLFRMDSIDINDFNTLMTASEYETYIANSGQ